MSAPGRKAYSSAGRSEPLMASTTRSGLHFGQSSAHHLNVRFCRLLFTPGGE